MPTKARSFLRRFIMKRAPRLIRRADRRTFVKVAVQSAIGTLLLCPIGWASDGSTLKLLRIATLGHFGHGKTTLIAAILATVDSHYSSARSISYKELDAPKSTKQSDIYIASVAVNYGLAGKQFQQVDCHQHGDHVKY